MRGTSTTSPVVYAVLMAAGCLAAVCLLGGMEDASTLHLEVGINKEAADVLGDDDQTTAAEKLADQESQNHLEHLQSKLRDHESKLVDEKQVLRQQMREYKRTMQSEQDSLTQYKDRISRQEKAVGSLKGKISTLKWAEGERESLHGKPTAEKDVWGETVSDSMKPTADANKESIMPPPTRFGDDHIVDKDIVSKQQAGISTAVSTDVSHSRDMQLDQSIGSAFKSYFEHNPEPTLVQLPTTDTVQDQVRAAARTAAQAAAAKAKSLGLDAAGTAAMVKDAARLAAKSVAAKAETSDLSEVTSKPATTTTKKLHTMPPSVGSDLHKAAVLKAAATKEAMNNQPTVHANAIQQLVSKQAKETLKAKEQAHKAEAEAEHVKAKEARVAQERDAAQAKLKKLEKAATAGNTLLGAKYETEMHKKEQEFQAKLNKVKTVTKEKALAKGEKKANEELAKEKKMLKLKEAKVAADANHKALVTVKKALRTAAAAKKLAQKEAREAEHAKAFSQTVSKAAEARTEAVKAAAAKQMATMEEEKKKAVEHFEEFSVKLKKMESEKESKNSEKMVSSAKHADKFLTDAAKAARVAEAKTNEAEFAKSKAAVSEAKQAKAVLEAAIKDVKDLGLTVRGKVALAKEKDEIKDTAEKRKEDAHTAILEAKEHTAKLKIKKDEAVAKQKHLANVAKAQAATKELAVKHQTVHNEAYQKGRADAEKVFAKRLADQKAHSLEKQAKALLKAGIVQPTSSEEVKDATSTPVPATETSKAQELVKDAIEQASSQGGDASTAVQEAMTKMAKFHDDEAASSAVPPALP